MRWLGTTKPFITLADYKLEMFKPIIYKLLWNIHNILLNILQVACKLYSIYFIIYTDYIIYILVWRNYDNN